MPQSSLYPFARNSKPDSVAQAEFEKVYLFLQNQLDKLRASYDSLQSQIGATGETDANSLSSLLARLTALELQVRALTARVAVLESSAGGLPVSSLQYYFSPDNDVMFVTTPGGLRQILLAEDESEEPDEPDPDPEPEPEE